MAESLEVHVIRAFFAKTEKTKPFSEVKPAKANDACHDIVSQAEIDACIEKMADDNKLMRSEDTIFVI
jgi:hypothetical protein